MARGPKCNLHESIHRIFVSWRDAFGLASRQRGARWSYNVWARDCIGRSGCGAGAAGFILPVEPSACACACFRRGRDGCGRGRGALARAASTRIVRLSAALLEADQRGQYAAGVLVNGVPVPMLIDTGASHVCVSASTARRLGLSPSGGRKRVMQTANGQSTASPTVLRSVSLGPFI